MLGRLLTCAEALGQSTPHCPMSGSPQATDGKGIHKTESPTITGMSPVLTCVAFLFLLLESFPPRVILPPYSIYKISLRE